jgi:ribose transport system substrate-binding protein
MISRREFIRSSPIAGSVVLAGCSGELDGIVGEDSSNRMSNNLKAAGESKDIHQIAMSLPTLQNVWFSRAKNKFEESMSTHNNLKGLLYNADGNPLQQITNIEAAITKDVDFIIIDPLKGKGVDQIVSKLHEFDIPVVNLDREIQNATVATYVAANNVAMGRRSTELCLNFMKERANKAQYNIIQLEGVPGSSVAGDRSEGFQKALNKNDELNLIASQPANFLKRSAISLMEDFVTSYGDKIDGVFCQNDRMALGAYDVLRSNDMGNVPITGIDGVGDWLKTFANNPYHGTIGQLPEKMVRLCIKYGINIVEGKRVPESKTVRSVTLTQNNYKSYLKKYIE